VRGDRVEQDRELSNSTVPPRRTSNRAVPGVVMTELIRPDALMCSSLPGASNVPPGISTLACPGRHVAAAAAVSVGPSPLRADQGFAIAETHRRSLPVTRPEIAGSGAYCVLWSFTIEASTRPSTTS
jgi:hypothetical protein